MSGIVLCMLLLGASAEWDDETPVQVTRGSNFIQINRAINRASHHDHSDEETDVDELKVRNGKSGKGRASTGTSADCSKPTTCIGCGGCTSTACSKTEACCNKFKDFQNIMLSIKNQKNAASQNGQSYDCAAALNTAYDGSALNTAQCGNPNPGQMSPCFKCFVCKSSMTNFCPDFKSSIGCGGFWWSLLGVNSSSVSSATDMDMSNDMKEELALMSRATQEVNELAQNTDSTLSVKQCI